MDKLINYVCDELEELERKVAKDNKLSMAEIQYMDTLAHAKKNLMKGEEMPEYSGMMYPRYYGEDRMGGRSYEDRSYARGRKRDSMGRYSRGYSMATEDIMDELHELMEKAPDEQTKREFKKFIGRIETM